MHINDNECLDLFYNIGRVCLICRMQSVERKGKKVKKNLLKKVMLFLAISMMIPVIVSCAKAPQKPSESSGTNGITSGGESDAKLELPNKTYNGYDFRVFCRPEANSDTVWVSDLFAEAEDSTRVGSAVYKRNEWVCDLLDCKLSYTLSSNSNMETDAMTVLFSGEDAYDLLMPHGRSIMTYADEGYLLDWEKDLVWCDLDKPWWDQEARETFSINNRLYVMNGDISYMSIGYTFAMFFNKDLMDELKIEYPYETVKNGEWTFDVFQKMVKQGAKDMNGDGNINVGEDRFGYSTHEHGASFQVMYSTGSQLLLKDSDDIPYCPGVTDATDKAYSEFYSLIDSSYATMYFNKDGDKSVDVEAEQALFWDTYVNGLTTMGDYDFEFGLVPWPNFNEGDEGYSCHVSCYVHEFGVPYTVLDAERTSAIIEALCYGGYQSVIDEYYEQTLQIQKSRDEESKEMLQIIKDSRAYDLGFFHTSLDPLSNMGNLIATIPTHSLATFYNKYKTSIDTKLAELIEKYE